MMMLDHVLLGGLGGLVLKNSPLAFTLGVATHFLLDKIPHFFPSDKKQQYALMAFDTLASFSFLAFFWLSPFSRSVFWGALGGFLVDVVLVGIPFILKSKIGEWHVKRQPHRVEAKFLLLDLAVFALSVFLLWRLG